MTARHHQTWQGDFGLTPALYPGLFTGKDQLTSTVPQAHILRHAFDQLELDGILCVEGTPLIYFKEVAEIDPGQARELHRQFWNHGGAAVLTLVSPTKVQVYSGMTRPAPGDLAQSLPALVETLNRVATELRKFLISVESGEFFHRHSRSFDPEQRVDRALLTNLRDARDALGNAAEADTIPTAALDALLCRLVFTCYLFDRKVIDSDYLIEAGLPRGLMHLRDILNVSPAREAKYLVYELFRKLGEDFNGDLFSGDLTKEFRAVRVEHVRILNDFFHGTRVRDGQRAFWPYDFAYIPIEAISGIYEHFLDAEDRRGGAFYTPRFLVELILESALKSEIPLIGKTFLDPACGSGIFLVGLFNRIAEEWTQENPTAGNERRARELMHLLQQSLFGVDKSLTACRITAFSLYLAYLDKLSPRDIRYLRSKGPALPRLLVPALDDNTSSRSGNIFCADFFDHKVQIPRNINVVVGNPPWGSTAGPDTAAGKWCASHDKPLPDGQIAVAFVWKVAYHARRDGRVCLVLPHGTLFNHGTKAVAFQKAWLRQHTLESVLNLADLRLFLFSDAIHPAIVVNYRGTPPLPETLIDYVAPKADWPVMFGDIVTVSSIDRSVLSLRELQKDLEGPDAPQVWTQRFWGSPRDLRLIDRLSLYPRLRNHIQVAADDARAGKRWTIAEGFQPVGINDDSAKAKTITLPSNLFIAATSQDINLFLLAEDCTRLPSRTIDARDRSNSSVAAFKAPHVLVTKGFKRIAFANFDVAFRHALRGIGGPKADSSLLAFLAAYLRTPLARFFIFHTSNWGIYRPEAHVQELLRLPMPLPENLPDPRRANAIVEEVASIVERASELATKRFLSRDQAIEDADCKLSPLIEEYFDVQELERILIRDTMSVVVPSIQPSYRKMPVPSIEASTAQQRDDYIRRVCTLLNGWARRNVQPVDGFTLASVKLGVAVAILERGVGAPRPKLSDEDALIQVLDRLRSISGNTNRALVAFRDIMVFDHNRLYLIKPNGKRYWTESAALNDADEIAATILLQAPGIST
jgi:hypothetical protein